MESYDKKLRILQRQDLMTNMKTLGSSAKRRGSCYWDLKEKEIVNLIAGAKKMTDCKLKRLMAIFQIILLEQVDLLNVSTYLSKSL